MSKFNAKLFNELCDIAIRLPEDIRQRYFRAALILCEGVYQASNKLERSLMSEEEKKPLDD